MRWRKRIGAGIAVAAAIGLVALALRPAAIPVETGTVRRGPLEVVVEEDGETRVRERFLLAAPVGGRLGRVQVDAGDPVKAGDVVARIYPSPLDPRAREEAIAHLRAVEAERRAAAARVERASAAFEEALRDLARAEGLARAGQISEDELSHARLDETIARLERDAARHALQAADEQVRMARAALLGANGGEETLAEMIEVRAPVEGRVLRLYEKGERTLPAGAPILEVGDTRELEIVLDLLTEEAARVRPGDRVRARAGERTFAARVRLVEPSAFTKASPLGVDEQRVNVIADFTETPKGVGDGWRIEGEIIVWDAPDVLKVPASALFRDAEEWAVFVVEEGRARLRRVRIGHRGAREVEVLGGVEEGATVIVHPSDEVEGGARVAGE